jgi:hypothetical protein
MDMHPSNAGVSGVLEVPGWDFDEKYSLPAEFLEGLETREARGAFGSKPGGGVASLVILDRNARGFKN